MLSIIDSDTARSTILRRVNLGDEAIPDSILDRIQTTFGERLSPQEAVTRILHEVRTLGDEALRSWTEKLDGKAPGAFRVPRDSLLAALGSLSQEERTALELSNLYGLEHLCLAVSEPWAWSEKVMSAGGIFMGEYSFEVLGDYVAGPSHVMPTSGTARFASPLNVWDFVRTSVWLS